MSTISDWYAKNAESINSGIQGFGAGVSAISAASAADSQKAMYNFQAQLARNNSMIDTWMASDARTRGATNVQNVQLKAAAVKSDQRASMAANGIDLAGSGTAADILGTTDYMGQRDAITAQHNADMEAWAYDNKAIQDTASANMATSTADSINPIMAFGSSLLTSATSYAKNYGAMKTAKGG